MLTSDNFIMSVTVKSPKTSDGKIKKDILFPKNELAELLLTSRKTIYYICADVHMFQHGIIRGYGHSLEQIVCGTGGADMDNFTLHMQTINKETIRTKIYWFRDDVSLVNVL